MDLKTVMGYCYAKQKVMSILSTGKNTEESMENDNHFNVTEMLAGQTGKIRNKSGKYIGMKL